MNSLLLVVGLLVGSGAYNVHECPSGRAYTLEFEVSNYGRGIHMRIAKENEKGDILLVIKQNADIVMIMKPQPTVMAVEPFLRKYPSPCDFLDGLYGNSTAPAN